MGFVLGEMPRSLLEGRLEILRCFIGVGMGAGLTTSSGFKNDPSLPPIFGERPLGGECGGSTVSSGASSTGRGVNGLGEKAPRAGDCGKPFSLGKRGVRPGFLGIGGGSFGMATASGSRGLSGRGTGEAVRLAGRAG